MSVVWGSRQTQSKTLPAKRPAASPGVADINRCHRCHCRPPRLHRATTRRFLLAVAALASAAVTAIFAVGAVLLVVAPAAADVVSPQR